MKNFGRFLSKRPGMEFGTPDPCRLGYYGLMLVGESQGLDLEEIWFPQKAIDIDT